MTQTATHLTVVQEVAPITARMPLDLAEMHTQDAKTRAKRIAWVLLMVEPGAGGPRVTDRNSGQLMSARQFADEGFWGLGSSEVVMDNLRLGIELIAAGLMDQPVAGKLCRLPSSSEIAAYIKRTRPPKTKPDPASTDVPKDPNEDQGFQSDVGPEQADWESPGETTPGQGKPGADRKVQPLQVRLNQLSNNYMDPLIDALALTLAETMKDPEQRARVVSHTTMYITMLTNLLGTYRD